MYEKYWGITERPFENTPDPKFFYLSSQHKEALARMLYAVHGRKGAAIFTGECGSGKTLLTRVLWKELQNQDRNQPVFILNPRLSGLEFIQEIVYQLTLKEYANTKIDLFHQLHKVLHTNFEKGKHVIIVVDEAQAIEDKEIFEELRLLLNFQLDNAFLLTIILLGQPELKEMILNIPPLNQRIAIRFHLTAFDEKETKEYIKHRLKIVGCEREIFTEEAYHQIFLSSDGIPRRINTICDLSLLTGFGNNFTVIDRDTILKVSEDLKLEGVDNV